MKIRLAALLSLGAVALGPGCPAGAEKRLAPIERRQAKSTHGPYGAGACGACHARQDEKNPGPALKLTNELCYDCHDEFARGKAVRMDRSVHPVSDAPCLSCHNPHNARKPKLQL